MFFPHSATERPFRTKLDQSSSSTEVPPSVKASILPPSKLNCKQFQKADPFLDHIDLDSYEVICSPEVDSPVSVGHYYAKTDLIVNRPDLLIHRNACERCCCTSSKTGMLNSKYGSLYVANEVWHHFLHVHVVLRIYDIIVMVGMTCRVVTVYEI